MNRLFLLAFIFLIGLLFFWSDANQFDSEANKIAKHSEEKTQTVRLPQQRSNGIDPKDQQSPAERDYSSYEELSAYFELAPYHQFKKEEVSTPLAKQTRYQFEQNGIAIIGMDFVLEEDRKGAKTVTRMNYHRISEVDTQQNVMPMEDLLQKSNLQSLPYSAQQFSKIIYVESEKKDGVFAVVLPAYDPVSKRQGQFIFRATDGQLLAKTFSRKF